VNTAPLEASVAASGWRFVHGTVTALVQFVAADGRLLFIRSWSLWGTN